MPSSHKKEVKPAVIASAEMHGGQVSACFFDHGLYLPSGAGLSEDDLTRVITPVIATLSGK
jgi:hypothetical protein